MRVVVVTLEGGRGRPSEIISNKRDGGLIFASFFADVLYG